MNLWSRASELGSKLKDTLQLSASDKPLVEKDVYDQLKEEYIKLKNEFDEKSKKYDNVIEEINNKKQKEENLTEEEYKTYFNEMTNKFKAYMLDLFGEDNNIKDDINLLFINPHNEDFDKKIKEYDKNKLENRLIKYLISNNKNIIEDLFLYKYSPSEEKNDDSQKEQKDEKMENKEESDNKDGEKEEDNSKPKNDKTEIDLNEINNLEDINKIFLKIQNNKKSMESLIEELQTKLSNDEKRFQSMQENIEKFQKDYKEIKNDEDSLKEIIDKKDNDLLEKETKINELKSLIEKNDNDMKEKDINISGYKTNIEQLNLKLKEQTEQINLFEQKKALYEGEIKNLNLKIKSFKDDMDLLQVNSEEINNKNIQITELMQSVESLKSSYKILEESKLEFAKEKNEEIDIYKNQILELTQQLNEINEKIQNKEKDEEIENLYVQKISELEKQNINYEKNCLELKKQNDDIKKELQETKNKMIKELRDNEFMIDKRVISSVLVSYFDVNASDLTKKNLLETLSSIMEYSNEDREKMGLKPIHIGDKDKNESGKLKSISDGLYNFILNS